MDLAKHVSVVESVLFCLEPAPSCAACSNGYYADPAGLQQRHSTIVGQQSAAAPVKRQEPWKALASVPDQQLATTGMVGQASDITVGRAKEFRPWPKRGAPEAQPLEAEESAREQ